jgi:hypothetical protein
MTSATLISVAPAITMCAFMFFRFLDSVARFFQKGFFA